MNAVTKIRANQFDAAFDRCIAALNAQRSRFYAASPIWEGRRAELTCAEDTVERLPAVADACFELMATLIGQADSYMSGDNSVSFIGHMQEELDNTFLQPLKAEIAAAREDLE